MKYNEKGEQLVEHHTHYKEIHGYDETVWMTKGKHEKLHNRLRREGKCNIPVEEMKKISIAAGNRTDKRKEYARSPTMKEYYRGYRETKEYKKYQKEYQKEYYGTNREKKILYQTKYQKEHKEERNKYQREYRARKKLEREKTEYI